MPRRARPAGTTSSDGHSEASIHSLTEAVMGKYFLGWLLGVPAIVLLIVYFFFGG